MDRPAVRGRSTALAAGVAAVFLFLGLVARFWHPVYGFTSFLQLDSSNDDTKIAAFREHPVFVYRDTGGYDGFFYAQIAYHPTLAAPELARAVDGLAYRGRRILAPLLARALALGKPAWIVHVYSLLNVAAWLLLAACLWRLLAVRDAWGWLAWAGVLFSAGALFSVRLALTDLIALTVLAGAMLAAERGRETAAIGALAAAGLARETSVFALPGFWERPWISFRNAARSAAAVAPLAAWIGYIRWRIGPSGAGARNLGWPLVGWVEKWRLTFTDMRTSGETALIWTTILATLALTIQAVYLVARPRIQDRWWRLGAAYVALFLILGPAVWEGYPGAATRVLLPMTLAFNVLAGRNRSSLAWLLAGNLAVGSGLLALKDVPRDPTEFAAVRAGGTACVARLVEGSYSREHDRDHVWFWSRGETRLTLEAWPKDATALRLEFAARAVSAGRLVLRQDGREVWRGKIGVETSGRQSVPILLTRGRGTLEFAADIPPIRESAASNARLLAFALYDPRLLVTKPGPD